MPAPPTSRASRDIIRASRRTLTRPAAIAFFVVMPLLLMVYAKHPGGLSTFAPWRVFSNYAISLIMYGFCYLTAGWFILQALRFGVPFYWGLVAMGLCGTVVTTVAGGVYLFTENDAPVLMRYAATCFLMSLIGTFLIVEANRDKALRAVNVHYPDAVPYWPRRPNTDNGVWDDVIQMQAQNQYTLVMRESGQELIRTSLADMVKQVPANLGFRIHRSYWLRADQIAEATYQNGNAKVVTVSGATLPLSRSMVSEIKTHLVARNI